MQESLKSSGMIKKKLKPYSLEKSYLLLKKEKKKFLLICHLFYSNS